jgi:hypothetical protein
LTIESFMKSPFVVGGVHQEAEGRLEHLRHLRGRRRETETGADEGDHGRYAEPRHRLIRVAQTSYGDQLRV